MTLGAILRSGRKAAGLTQRDLAAILGIDFTYISKIENDAVDFPPSEKLLRGMADALRLDRDDVLFAAGKVPCDIVMAIKADRALLRTVRALVESRERHTSGDTS